MCILCVETRGQPLETTPHLSLPYIVLRFNYFVYVSIVWLHMHAQYLGSSEGKNASDLLELELWMTVSRDLGASN